MRKTIEIKGVTFEVEKPSQYRLNPWRGFLNIHECYGRPSSIKVAIYEDWKNWFLNNEDADFSVEALGVISYNCNFFTIGAIVEYCDKLYNITITRSHNRISEILWYDTCINVNDVGAGIDTIRVSTAH